MYLGGGGERPTGSMLGVLAVLSQFFHVSAAS